MYRLLIVTEDPKMKEMITGMDGWQALGVKPPHLRATAEEAVEFLNSRHTDAIAVDDTPEFEGFLSYLNKYHPDLPLFTLANTPDEQKMVLRELYSLLTRLNADDSNDEHDQSYRMDEQRERWMKKILCGLVPNEQDMKRQMKLHRCTEQLHTPCVLVRMEMTDDDGFMSERWHYGSERLEVALRNFFGHQHDQMLMHVAVVSPQEVRILCYPADERGVSENAVFDYVQETADQVAHYLGLHMNVLDVSRVAGLADFAIEHGRV